MGTPRLISRSRWSRSRRTLTTVSDEAWYRPAYESKTWGSTGTAFGVSWPRLGTATATASSRAGQDRITENLEADCLFCILDFLAACFLDNHTARLTV